MSVGLFIGLPYGQQWKDAVALRGERHLAAVGGRLPLHDHGDRPVRALAALHRRAALEAHRVEAVDRVAVAKVGRSAPS